MSSSSILLTSAMAMTSQSHSMEQIGSNIANVNTVGYKKAETMFSTLLSGSLSSSSGNSFTAGTNDRRHITTGGNIITTGSKNDVSISGNGYFLLSNDISNYSDEGTYRFSRAGDFQTIESNGNVYLVNQEGANVLGWNYDLESGKFSNSLEPLETSILTTLPGLETKNVSIRANIQAVGNADSKNEKISFTAYDANYNSHVVSLDFNANSTANNWDFGISVEGGSVSSPISNVEFNSDATIKSPAGEIMATINWDDGTVSNINIDLSGLSQYATETSVYNIDSDGAGVGKFSNSYWDDNGILQAVYSNSEVIPICKLAIADFTEPNALEAISGTMFKSTGYEGEMKILDLEDTLSSYSSIYGETLEASNVSIEQEFSNMITTQQAYNSSSTVFQTGDEMYQEAIKIMA